MADTPQQQQQPMTLPEINRARNRLRHAELVKELRNRPEAQAIAALWNLPAFQVLLEHLREKFYDCELIGESDAETFANLGAREVVRALLDLRKRTERTGA
jgi:hypothetical protein